MDYMIIKFHSGLQYFCLPPVLYLDLIKREGDYRRNKRKCVLEEETVMKKHYALNETNYTVLDRCLPG